MSKTSKEEVMNFFMHFCKDLGKAVVLSKTELKKVKLWGTEHWEPWCEIVDYGTVGAWKLDYNSIYGGYQIQEVDNDAGGVSCPLGHKRFKAAQFLEMLIFAREALRLKSKLNHIPEGWTHA